MADLAFARQFLTTLSSRPSALSPTHVEDPKTYPARGAYILPHSSLPPLKKRKRATASTDKLNITLTSPRNPTLSVDVQQPSSISVLELKNLVSEDASIPVSKIKVLFNKKPVGDAKTLSELLGDETPDKVELGLMIMGGASSILPRSPPSTSTPKSANNPGTDAAPTPNIDERPETEAEKAQDREIEMKDVSTNIPGIPSTAVGMHGRNALMTPEFWDDLTGFLVQRLKDEKLGNEIGERFRQGLVGGV